MDPKKFKSIDEAKAAGETPIYYYAEMKDAMEVAGSLRPPTEFPGERCDIMFSKVYEAYYLTVYANHRRSDIEQVIKALRELGIEAIRVNDEGEPIQ